MIGALRELAKQNPTKSPAKSEKIFGEWNLLWASENAEARPQLPIKDCRAYTSACLPLQIIITICKTQDPASCQRYSWQYMSL